MTPMAAVHDAIFADPHLAADGVYIPPGGGGGQPCRVRLAAPDQAVGLLGAGVSTAAVTATLRVSEVADIREKGVLAVGDQRWRVAAASHVDADRLLWRLDLEVLR